jgi:hypothetical protein
MSQFGPEAAVRRRRSERSFEATIDTTPDIHFGSQKAKNGVVLALSRVLSFCSALVALAAKAIGLAMPQSLFFCEDAPNNGVFGRSLFSIATLCYA